jgi:serine/threonine protein kinase
MSDRDLILAKNIDNNSIVIGLHGVIGKGGEGIVYLAKSNAIDTVPFSAKKQAFNANGFASILNSLMASMMLSSRITKGGCNEKIMCLKGLIVDPSKLELPNFKTLIDSLPGIKKLIYVSDTLDKKTCIFLYEYVEGASLDKVIHGQNQEQKQKQEQKQQQSYDIKSYCKQLLEIIALIHSKTIVHLDIKPDNIMVTPNNILKLIDFGYLCRVKTPSCKRLGATFEYGAPEVYEPLDDNKKKLYSSDVFALGLTMYEVITGKRALNQKEALDFVKMKTGELDLEFTETTQIYKPLIQKMILRDWIERISANEALDMFMKITDKSNGDKSNGDKSNGGKSNGGKSNGDKRRKTIRKRRFI